MTKSAGREFRRLLREEPYVYTGGVYSPLDAQIAERVGLRCVYMSGYSVAMLNGWPDMGFLTMTEMTRTASTIADAVGIPVIADADDGYGNALSTMRTVAVSTPTLPDESRAATMMFTTSELESVAVAAR